MLGSHAGLSSFNQYRFELKYRNGGDNKNADGLSRSRELTVEAKKD